MCRNIEVAKEHFQWLIDFNGIWTMILYCHCKWLIIKWDSIMKFYNFVVMSKYENINVQKSVFKKFTKCPKKEWRGNNIWWLTHELYYAERLGNHAQYTFIITLFKRFSGDFLCTVLSNFNDFFKQIYLTHR